MPQPVKRKPDTKQHHTLGLISNHVAVLMSRRYSTYACTTCGPLGPLSEAIAHAIAHQYIVPPQS